MNSIIAKVLVGLLSLFTIVYFGYQIYHMTYTPYATETALSVEFTDQVELEGIAIRTEQLLHDDATGVVKYVDSDSKKVVADSIVATVYNSDEDLKIGVQIDQKQQKLDMLETLESKQQSTTNVQSVVDDMRQAQLDFVSAVETNDYDNIHMLQIDELSQMLRQQLILDHSMSFAAEINALSTEIDQLSKSLSASKKTITVPSSGYFTNLVDGYETVLTEDYCESFETVTVDEVQGLMTQQPTGGNKAVGKLITTTQWYFLGLFDASKFDKIVLDTEILLKFPNSAGYSMKATIQEVSLEDDAEQGIVLLSSNNMNDVVVDLRVEQPAMVFSMDKGISVSKDAVRIVETEEVAEDGSVTLVSKPGVYITTGQLVLFKEIDVIYEGADYIISELHEDESNYLHIYDEVILEGDDLYDGKAIR